MKTSTDEDFTNSRDFEPPIYNAWKAIKERVEFTHKFVGNLLRPVAPIRLDLGQQRLDAPSRHVEF